MEQGGMSPGGPAAGAETLMVGPWLMGGILLVVVLILILAIALIVLSLRRIPTEETAGRIRGGALRRVELPPPGPSGEAGPPPSGEIDGFLVIPDISGYTQFMQLSAYALAHAQYAVSELLNSVIEAAADVLATAKVEGDAVFLYGVRAARSGQGGLTGAEIGQAIGALLRAFYRKRAELMTVNACTCEVCQNVDRLELKVVVHCGELLVYNLRGQRELSGLPVIVAHRLLKSDIESDRYVLVTEAAGSELAIPIECQKMPHAQAYDGIGEIASVVHTFNLEALLAGMPSERPGTGAKAADAARKMLVGLRAIRGGSDS